MERCPSMFELFSLWKSNRIVGFKWKQTRPLVMGEHQKLVPDPSLASVSVAKITYIEYAYKLLFCCLKSLFLPENCFCLFMPSWICMNFMDHYFIFSFLFKHFFLNPVCKMCLNRHILIQIILIWKVWWF